MSVATFDGHGDGFVLAVDWHPDGVTVASAGEDDKGYVWTVRLTRPPRARACAHA